MLLSKLVGDRVKETPSDVKIKSHALLARAGYIKPVANGIFSLTSPAQLMAVNIERILREEMNAVEGQEVKFPVVMPREMWDASGRYSSIGSEMVRFKDRLGKDMLLGMTHEEAAVHMAKSAVSSHNQLPFMIYQIQTKFRDEPRSRGGLIRVREFTMKDAYSFHMTQEDLEQYYARVYRAYNRIFHRIGLKKFIAVKSDTGMMGGSVAHEFMLLTEVGEDTLVLCDSCGYRSNMEVATGVRRPVDFGAVREQPVEVFTGEAKDIAAVCEMLNVPATNTMKAVVYAVKGDEETIVVAFVRGDLEVNEAKLKKCIGKNIVPWDASSSDALCAGNIGAYGLELPHGILVFDESLKGAYNMVAGANKPEYHIKGIDVDRDIHPDQYYDIAKATAEDACPVCGGKLHLENGIEIGNIFQLGIKYTKSMDFTVLNDKGESIYPIMGCYGIGVGRAIGSIAQESNDDYGLILPASIAPYKVHITPLRLDDAEVRTKAFALYDALMNRGINTLIDDREGVSNGVKFADADLMGMPLRVVVSPKGLKDGIVEIKVRDGGEILKVPFDNAVQALTDKLNELIAALDDCSCYDD